MLAQLQTAVSLIYPPACMACDERVDRDGGLCGACWRKTAFIGGLVCDACGAPLPGGELHEVAHCDACLSDPPPWVRGRAALLYRDTGRKLVLALKHGDRQDIAGPAALWMARAIKDHVPVDTVVAPVPLHWTRLLKRRFNQSALLGKALARDLKQAWCPDLLHRVRRTRSLDGKGRAERFEALAGAMVITDKRRGVLNGRSVLLVDDVITSGATLTCAARACLDAGATSIRVVALARVVKET